MQNKMGTDPQALLAWAREQYGVLPEYLWAKSPGFAVLRHPHSGRWFAVLMQLPSEKLGLHGGKHVDIVNVKCDPLLTGFLQRTYSLQAVRSFFDRDFI